MRPRALVIGGGLGGMGASLCLGARGWSVTLLEAGTRLGTGWSSERWMEEEADLGLRIPCETGVPWADALLFHGLPVLTESPLVWNRIGPLPLEAQLDPSGALRVGTMCLDARFLAPPLLARAMEEVLCRAALPDPGPAAPHLDARLEALFGPTLLRHALLPACQSLLGLPPGALAWNAAELRLPSRIVLADSAATSRLMRHGLMAQRLAHPRATEVPVASGAPSYLYPAQGGIGRWRAALEAALRRAGVTVRTGSRVVRLGTAGESIAGLELDSGETLPAELVILAAPLSALPTGAPTGDPAPRHAVSAVAAVVETPALPALHWLTSYDPRSPFMRACFVPRLRGPVRTGPCLVLAEMREPRCDDLLPSLKRLDLLPAEARAVATRVIGQGSFAVETPESAAARAEARRAAAFRNLAVMSSAEGGHSLVATLFRDAARIAEQWSVTQAAA